MSAANHDPTGADAIVPASVPVPTGAVVAPLLVACATLFGSIWLSVGLKLKACPLCFYQRSFVMGAVAVLGIGLLTGQRHRAALNVLTLPLVLAGAAVATFHVSLEALGRLECPGGLLGLGTAPQQSLAMFAVLLALTAAGIARTRGDAACRPATVGAALALGLLLAVASIVSAPPLPPVPAKPYPSAFDMCRPPFREQQGK